ncbi:unnamed protein product [Leuciscus chuanchicus]
MSKWMVEAISLAYEAAGQPSPLAVRSHSTRSMAASKALISGVSLQDVCDAAGWSSPHTFVREIHNICQDYALRESQRESETTSNQTTGSTENTSDNSDTTDLLPTDTQQAEELKSDTMTFVTEIKETTEELQAILDTLRDAMHPNSDPTNTDN